MSPTAGNAAHSCLLCRDREGRGGRKEPWSPLYGPCVVSFSGRDVLLGAELDEGALDWQVRGTIPTGSKNGFHRKVGEEDEERFQLGRQFSV